MTCNLWQPVSCSPASFQPDGSFCASLLGKQPVFYARGSEFPASLLAAAVFRSTDRGQVIGQDLTPYSVMILCRTTFS